MEKLSLIEHFSIIDDPRVNRRKKHKLIDIIVLSMCAVISGCDSWTEIEEFAEIREDFFKQFLDLPSGIPSHDTFGRVFSLIDPDAFLEAFINWVTMVHEIHEGEVINLDGKMLRAVSDTKFPLGIVTAWASTSGIALGQVKIERKQGEKEAFKKLLDLLFVRGCIVTIDANGCHANIVNKVVEKGGDYIVALKANQKSLLKQVQQQFDTSDIVHTAMTEEKSRDRLEKRVCDVLALPPTTLKFLNKKVNQRRTDPKHIPDEWLKIESVVRITSYRTVKGKTSEEVRFYLSSLPAENSQRFLNCIRSHWSIENKLHYVLDTSFREDSCTVRNKRAAENFSLIRRFALNVVRSTRDPKKSIRLSRKRASWDGKIMMDMVLGATSAI